MNLFFQLIVICFFFTATANANPDTSCNQLLSTKEKIVRIALCQIDTTVADFDYNVRHILRFIKKAGELNTDIAVFPELVVSSYPPRDLLERSDFIFHNERAIEKILTEIQKIPSNLIPKTIVLGSITRNPKTIGRSLQNAALIIQNGKIVHTQAKQLLPNYDVFDEARYFEPATTSELWNSDWGKIGCSICEDAWHESTTNNRKLYENDPAQKLRGAELLININASPFELNKHVNRKNIVSNYAKRISAPLIYVNQVGAQDNILFDGRSLVLSQAGETLFELPSFKEAIGIAELKLSPHTELHSAQIFSWNPTQWTWTEETANKQNLYTQKISEIEELELALVAGIKGYFSKVGYEKAVLGLSGGIDSSIVATLAVEALGNENVIGVSMPSKYSSDGSLTDAEALAKNLGIKYIVSPIKDSVHTMMQGLDESFEQLKTNHDLPQTQEDTTEDNIQARLRAVILTAVANKFDALTLTTSNKSELSVGQTTMYGDMAGALAPIGDLFKTRVYELGKHLNRKKFRIPETVFTKPASAELAPGQTDEAKFGAWPVLDAVLEMYIEKQMSPEQIIELGFDAQYVRKTICIVNTNEFKRNQAAIILKVTPKAFGSGRRIPVANFYRPIKGL